MASQPPEDFSSLTFAKTAPKIVLQVGDDKEEPVFVFSYVAETDLTTNSLLELYRALSRMGRQANQGEIRVVIDGKYYGITEYVEE